MSTTTQSQEYQETELGELPKEWTTNKVSELFDITLKTRKLRIKDTDKVLFISMENISETSASAKYEYKPLAKIPSGVFVLKHDLIISKITPCFENGKQALLSDIPEEHAWATTEVIPLHPKDNRVTAKHLFYYIKIHTVRAGLITKMEGATGRRRLSKNSINELRIPLPPLPEQERIAYVLSTVQEAKEASENTINSLKELKKSLMKHLFTYGAVSFQDADKVKLKETEIGMIPETWKASSIGAIAKLQGKVNVNSDNFVSFEHIESGTGKILWVDSAKRYKTKTPFVKGTLLYGKIRPYLNKVWLAEIDGFCTNDIIRIVTVDCDIAFLKYILLAPEFVKYATEKSTGTKMPRVNWDAITRYKITLPGIPEQQQIASILSSVDKKIDVEEQKKNALQETFNSLLKDLMTAKVRVKDFDIEAAEFAGIGKDTIMRIINENLPVTGQIDYSKSDQVMNFLEKIGGITIPESKEELLKNYQKAKKWLNFAEQDLKSCKVLLEQKMDRNAMVELQQGVEKLVKAYCFAFRLLSEKEIRDVGHKSPMAFVKLIKNEWVEPFVEIMKEHHPQLTTDTKELEMVIHYKDDELANISDNALDAMITYLENIEIALTEKNEEIRGYIQNILGQFEELLTEEQKNKFKIFIDKFDSRIACAFVNLYVISAVTYPHFKSRYPDEIITELMVYDDNLVVIKHINRIYKLLDTAVQQLNNFLVMQNGR
jgi:type I restriction enzyme S subunit